MDKSPQTDAVDRILEQWKRNAPISIALQWDRSVV